MNDRFVKVRLEAGTHYLCTCGKTIDKLFCDGSHVDTGMQPLALELDRPKDVESGLSEN